MEIQNSGASKSLESVVNNAFFIRDHHGPGQPVPELIQRRGNSYTAETAFEARLNEGYGWETIGTVEEIAKELGIQ